jgi:hypothetical protein
VFEPIVPGFWQAPGLDLETLFIGPSNDAHWRSLTLSDAMKPLSIDLTHSY